MNRRQFLCGVAAAALVPAALKAATGSEWTFLGLNADGILVADTVFIRDGDPIRSTLSFSEVARVRG